MIKPCMDVCKFSDETMIFSLLINGTRGRKMMFQENNQMDIERDECQAQGMKSM